jgi:rSAM/selenodomain-associated transferase 2/rSAM/selenodomain-associated transferase 1
LADTLSVIVPALDEAPGIAAALAALGQLRASGHEVIVVDGGSRDATISVATPLADHVLTAPRGRAVQMNVGASVARGDVLVFLHADCRLPESAADSIAIALRAGHRWGRFDVRLDGRSRALASVAAMMNVRSRLSGICTGDQGMFVERALFESVGGFPPIALMEDVALSRALGRVAGRPAAVPARMRVSARRWDERGALRTILQMWRLRFAYWRGTTPDVLAYRYYGATPAPRPTLQVFAKAPVPGRVKTRLAAAIGDAAAAEVYRRLVERTLGVALAARRAGVVGDAELWVQSIEDRDAYAAWCRDHGVALRIQQGRDLGERMHTALRSALGLSPALLIGTDVPGYDVRYLAAAAAALQSQDAVLGPAMDGGYVLIGLSRDVDAFSGIAWSTPDVMAASRTKLADAHATWQELPALTDIDTLDDLLRWKERGYVAADTR